MVDPVITIPERKLNYKFMLAEAIWILTGDNRLEPLTCYCKRMAEFSDDGVTLNGAYGIPYREQLMYVVDKLQSSPDTRQAVMTFWERCPSPSKDIPCTTALQFLIRGGMLHLNVFMRSWDLWLGFPYDIFSFSMIATHVSTFLRNVEPGMLTVTAGSAHIYSRDFAKISEVTKSDNGGKLDIYKYGKYTPDSLIMTLESNLNALNV
jgi:thymidylate synthase